MKFMINSNPPEFEGLRHTKLVQQTVAQIYKTPHHNDFVQAPPAQLSSGQNKERPPLTMEPAIDDPLAATTVTPAQAGVQRKGLDSRRRGNDKPCKAHLASNESEELGGVLA